MRQILVFESIGGREPRSVLSILRILQPDEPARVRSAGVIQGRPGKPRFFVFPARVGMSWNRASGEQGQTEEVPTTT
ncbi:MAG: hypothetical protein KAY09_03370 [Nitrospira sp.]|nr:hypothetical protein [Nitrospira sp.]